MQTKTGTYEWSDATMNVSKGCSNGCIYCYACANAVRRKWVMDHREWTKEDVIPVGRLRRRLPSVSGKVVMFPSNHDITDVTLPRYLEGLSDLILKGHKVLVVSKPRLRLIKQVADRADEMGGNVEFRFTIGSVYDDVLRFWEPNAPTCRERMDCAEYTRERGFSTSISVEPMLDDVSPVQIVDWSEGIADTVWIGLPRSLPTRLKLNGFITGPHRLSPFFEAAHALLANLNNSLPAIYNELKDNPRVMWKDSVQHALGLEGSEGDRE